MASTTRGLKINNEKGNIKVGRSYIRKVYRSAYCKVAVRNADG